MSIPMRAVLLSLFTVALTPLTGSAQESGQPQPAATLEATLTDREDAFVVGTKVAPPFAMKDETGAWTGLSIDLWREIARKLGRTSTFKEFDTADALVAAAADGKIDAGVAATSITAAREKVVDFTHPFYKSGLAIAVSQDGGTGLLSIMRALVSPEFLTTVGALVALLFLTGAVMWWVERKRNWDQFEREPAAGIGDGFWWAAVTMTTVGYGDKAPVTLAGRIIATIWMFAALILTALFTAQLASSLTAQKISGPVSGVGDLARARVGIVDQAASKDYFRNRFITTRPSSTVSHGLELVRSGTLDAFVHDEPILKYEIQQNHQDMLTVLPSVFEAQDYAIVLPPNAPHREAINLALLNVLNSDDWQATYQKYFGTPEN